MKNLTLTLYLVVLSFAFATNVFAMSLNKAFISAAGAGDLRRVRANMQMIKDLIGISRIIEPEAPYFDEFGGGALHYAVENDHIEVVKYLLEQGAKVDARDKDGMTPLIWVANNNNKPNSEAIIKLLLAKGADINATSKNGTTALIHAANGLPCPAKRDLSPCSRSKTLKLLLEKGADVTKKNDNEDTAMAIVSRIESGLMGTPNMDLLKQYAKKQEQTSTHRCPKCSHTFHSGDSAHHAPSSRSTQGARRAQ